MNSRNRQWIHSSYTEKIENSLYFRKIDRGDTVSSVSISRIQYQLRELTINGLLRTNFSILDIFAVVDMWNVHIWVKKILIREVKTKNLQQNGFMIFWSFNILSWSKLYKIVLTSFYDSQNLKFDWPTQSTIWFLLNWI